MESAETPNMSRTSDKDAAVKVEMSPALAD